MDARRIIPGTIEITWDHRPGHPTYTYITEDQAQSLFAALRGVVGDVRSPQSSSPDMEHAQILLRRAAYVLETNYGIRHSGLTLNIRAFLGDELLEDPQVPVPLRERIERTIEHLKYLDAQLNERRVTADFFTRDDVLGMMQHLLDDESWRQVWRSR
jgi:hypothetical protein